MSQGEAAQPAQPPTNQANPLSAILSLLSNPGGLGTISNAVGVAVLVWLGTVYMPDQQKQCRDEIHSIHEAHTRDMERLTQAIDRSTTATQRLIEEVKLLPRPKAGAGAGAGAGVGGGNPP